MDVSLIVAMTKKGVIGDGNNLPWPFSALKEDRKNFKRLTTGNSVIMGRNTWYSIPEKFRPLPDRQNIVVSSILEPEEGLYVARTLDEALELAENQPFIIGGRGIFREGLAHANKAYISWTKNDYSGDVNFPEPVNYPDFLPGWSLESMDDFSDFEFATYRK